MSKIEASILISLLVVSILATNMATERTMTYILELSEKTRQGLFDILETYFNTSNIESMGLAAPENLTATDIMTLANETSGNVIRVDNSTLYSLEDCSSMYDKMMEYINLANQFAATAESDLRSGNLESAVESSLRALRTLEKVRACLARCTSLLGTTRTEVGANTNIDMPTSPVEFHPKDRAISNMLSTILDRKIRLDGLRTAMEGVGDISTSLNSSWSLIAHVKDLLSQTEELTLERGGDGTVAPLGDINELISQIMALFKTGQWIP